jgi:hypothetical protein
MQIAKARGTLGFSGDILYIGWIDGLNGRGVETRTPDRRIWNLIMAALMWFNIEPYGGIRNGRKYGALRVFYGVFKRLFQYRSGSDRSFPPYYRLITASL